jgi:phenylpropionate dioxygenase-like ring-hydroxylating dioxygenase large terminal subunit
MYPLNLWYFAGFSQEFKHPSIQRHVLAGEPLAIGRDDLGNLIVLKDICPHRAAPFSAGKMQGQAMECPYHGWQFGKTGRCQKIPSLGTDPECQKKGAGFRVKTYPTHERNGLVWVFIAQDKWGEITPSYDPPRLPLPENTSVGMIERVSLPCSLDEAVIGLMDPAHGPFVHNNWFWRNASSIHKKTKHFVPSELGFTMKAHKPSKNAAAYRLLGGDITTEIRFLLPAFRLETIQAGKYTLIGLTCVQPVGDYESEIIQIFFWTIPFLTLAKPFVRPLVRRFLKQDQHIMSLQALNRPFNPVMTLMDDADTQAKWYYKLKRTWMDAQEKGVAFENPLHAKDLTWWS